MILHHWCCLVEFFRDWVHNSKGGNQLNLVDSIDRDQLSVKRELLAPGRAGGDSGCFIPLTLSKDYGDSIRAVGMLNPYHTSRIDSMNIVSNFLLTGK